MHYEIIIDTGFQIITETYITREAADIRYNELIQLSHKPSMCGLRVTKNYH